jgi:hypothetical protein
LLLPSDRPVWYSGLLVLCLVDSINRAGIAKKFAAEFTLS